MKEKVDQHKQIDEIAKVLAYCPQNKELFDIFEGQYICLSKSSQDIYNKYRFLYLVLKCINFPSIGSYSEIADYYLKTEDNRFLCFLSDLAVLRLNQTEHGSYNRAAAFAREFFNQKIESISPDNNKCGVSVIIPTYNRGQVIKESIESVLAQSVKDLEIIIVNDGGDDEVEETINSFADSRIKYIKIRHSGLAGALNAGLKKAEGEYVSYLDDDDIYYPDHLSTLLNTSKENKKDFVYAKSKVAIGHMDISGHFRPVKYTGTFTLPFSKSNLINYGSLGISVLNVLHKRSLARQAGFFNPELPWAMDWDFWMRMSDIHEPYFIDQWTGEYRKSSESMNVSEYYKGEFYKYHLLIPYFTTGYGALTLYSSACLLKMSDKDIWAKRLSSCYVSQEEVLRSIFKQKRLLFDIGFLSKSLLTTKFLRDLSPGRLLIQLLRVLHSKTLKFLHKKRHT